MGLRISSIKALSVSDGIPHLLNKSPERKRWDSGSETPSLPRTRRAVTGIPFTRWISSPDAVNRASCHTAGGRAERSMELTTAKRASSATDATDRNGVRAEPEYR